MAIKMNHFGIIGISLLLVACGDKGQEAQNQAQGKAAEATAAQEVSQGASLPIETQGAASAQGQFGNVGKLISIQAAGAYSYLEVENQAGKFWMASSAANVKPGQIVQWGEYAVMKQFASKALDRTFDQILFISQVVPYEAAQAPVNQGKVLSVTESAGYNYIEADTQQGVIWLAAPASSVVKGGDVVSWTGASEMTNFFSKSLKKNFKSILFVGAIVVLKKG